MHRIVPVLALLSSAFGQSPVIPAEHGVIPDVSVPFRTAAEPRRVNPALAKLPKEDEIPRQADDALGVGISPSLQALQRLAGIQDPNVAGSLPLNLPGQGLGASLAGSQFGGSSSQFGGSGSQFGGSSSQFGGSASQFAQFAGLGSESGGGSPFGAGSPLAGLGSGPLAVPPGLAASLAGAGGGPNFGGVPTGSILPAGLSGIPQNLAGLSGFGAPQGQTGGLLNVLGSLGSSLGRSLGIGNLLRPGQVAGSSGGPSVAGLPAVPGIPISPLGNPIGGSRGFDFLSLIGSLTRRAFNGSSVTDVLPPNRIQSLADNVTESLVPELSEIDLTKYMGRWFEGINSPKASEQRCPVHHYGGLTENGQTATFTALKIYRDGSEFGQVQYSIGYAFRGGRHPGMLQMHSSETRDPTPYWIYHSGPIGKDSFGNDQYEYVIVSNWIKYPITVLVRDPDDFKKKYYVDVLRWLEDNGFITDFSRAFNLIQPVDYSNCQYEDSTFAAFGRK